jgi:hypothetical protein
MKTWQIVLQLVHWRPVVYGIFLLFSLLVFGLPILSGVLMQQLFDALGGTVSTGPGLRDVLALLVALEFANVFSGEALSLGVVTFYYSGYACFANYSPATALLGCQLHRVRRLAGFATTSRSSSSRSTAGTIWLAGSRSPG